MPLAVRYLTTLAFCLLALPLGMRATNGQSIPPSTQLWSGSNSASTAAPSTGQLWQSPAQQAAPTAAPNYTNTSSLPPRIPQPNRQFVPQRYSNSVPATRPPNASPPNASPPNASQQNSLIPRSKYGQQPVGTSPAPRDPVPRNYALPRPPYRLAPQTAQQNRLPARRIPIPSQARARYPQQDTNYNRQFLGQPQYQPRHYPRPAPANPAPRIESARQLQSAQLIAMIGSQPILEGDLLAFSFASYISRESRDDKLVPSKVTAQAAEMKQYHEVLLTPLDQLSEEQREQREQLVKTLLEPMKQIKAVYVDFLRNAPPDQVPSVEGRLVKNFNEKSIPPLLEAMEASSAGDLDAKLREFGSSLAKHRRASMEQTLIGSMVSENIRRKEISYEELNGYYFNHIEEYEFTAKSRWEHLMARFDQFPNEYEARVAIWQMGNSVVGGARLADVARRSSQGVLASKGGQHDWTEKGSLRSDAIDTAIFTLPVGELSRRFQDDEGWHIVRVIERRDAGRVPLEEVRKKIKEKLLAERRNTQISDYLAKTLQNAHIWTIFDDVNRTAKMQRGPTQR